MKYFKPILLLTVAIFLAEAAFSQVKQPGKGSAVYAQRIILKYNKHGDSEMDSHADTLRIPVAGPEYPALKKALSNEKLFLGDDLKTLMANYADCGCGITNLDYEVTFENKDVISLKLFYETEAAYPSSFQQWLTLNKHTGIAYPLSAEIDQKGRNRLFKMYADTLLTRIAQDKIARTDEDSVTYDELKTNINQLESGELFSKYIFTDKGIVLSIEAILPHVVQDMEPDDDLFIPYTKLKPYILPKAIILKKQMGP